MDAAGFRLAVEAGLDLGAIVNAADTPERREWDEIVRRTVSRRRSPGATRGTTSASVAGQRQRTPRALLTSNATATPAGAQIRRDRRNRLHRPGLV